VPTPTRRFAFSIGVFAAVLILSGAGAGVAVAEPEDPGNPPGSGQSSEPGGPGETPPTEPPVPAVKSPLGQLRDLLQRPRAVFGNGRTPGPLVPEFSVGVPPIAGVEPGWVEPKPGGEPVEGEPVEGEPKEPSPVDPIVVDPRVDPPAKKPSWHTARVQLPFVSPFSVPLPTRPGARATQFSIDLSDPFKALTSVTTTLNQVGTLVTEAIAPYNPFPPKPPEPTLRITEETPVADAGGGYVGTGPASGGGASSSDPMPPMPVLQAPMAMPMPMPRIGPPRPVERTIPAGASPQVIGAGSAGVRAAEIKGSLTQTGLVPTSSVAPANTMSAGLGRPGNTALRQGYPQYLRSARIPEVAVIAVPGLAGLLALTASGGVLGYRQANSGRYLRADAARFLQ
jgi:hypothetical protein